MDPDEELRRELLYGKAPEPEPELNPAQPLALPLEPLPPELPPEPRRRRSQLSGSGSGSTTSSTWQLIIEDDAASRIQAFSRGQAVRRDLRAAHDELVEEGSPGVRFIQSQGGAGAPAPRGGEEGGAGPEPGGAAAAKEDAGEPSEDGDEELRLDAEFLAREASSSAVVEAWMGLTRSTAVGMVQAYARGWGARRLLRRRTASAVLIQAAVRGWLCRQALERRHGAARTIQSCARGHAARVALLVRHAAATRIQAAWRGCRCRLAQRQARQHQLTILLLRKLRKSALLKAFSRWVVWATETRQMRQTATVVVKRMLARELDMAFAQWVEGACFLKGQKLESATRIEAAVRGWISRRRLAVLLRGTLVLQAAVRGAEGRRQVAALRDSVVNIQKHGRGWLSRRELVGRHLAASVLQAVCRRSLVMRTHADMHLAATSIESVSRGWLARRRVAAMLSLATACQAAWRGHRCRVWLAGRRDAAVAIQSATRGWRARRAYAAALKRVRAVQCAWRGREGRRAVAAMHAAAVRMQAIERGRRERQEQIVRQACARTVQWRMRGWLERLREKKRVAAATRIQAAWRGWLARRELARARCWAVAVQKVWRGRAVRRVIARLGSAATTIQACWRGWKGRRHVRDLRAALCVQATWRGRLSRRWYLRWQRSRRYHRSAETAFAAKQFEEAVHDYTSAIRLENGVNPETFCARAAALTACGLLEDAVKDCERCLSRRPRHFEAFRRKGTALYALGRLEEADAAYRAGLAIEPGDLNAVALLDRLTTVRELRKPGGSRAALLMERAKILQKQNSLARLAAMPPGATGRPEPEAVRMQEAARFHARLRLSERRESFSEEQATGGFLPPITSGAS